MPLIKPWYLYSFAVETADSSILQTVINFIMHIFFTELLNMDIFNIVWMRWGVSSRWHVMQPLSSHVDLWRHQYAHDRRAKASTSNQFSL